MFECSIELIVQKYLFIRTYDLLSKKHKNTSYSDLYYYFFFFF